MGHATCHASRTPQAIGLRGHERLGNTGQNKYFRGASRDSRYPCKDCDLTHHDSSQKNNI
ncbi:hypothetical protein E2C01_025731 [Portunus trituberculatus]|uniref:Uncharacterized protein n=1 Tax=Portunus trituberculatus TaxID=210409 RepID=A0A5B7EE17_PORTR|nr:hypothetical protein [Portunus trituberculatus]